MPYVVLQQVSNDYAKHNAARTLDKSIDLKYLKKYFSVEDYEKYLSKYGDYGVYIWGSKLERQHQIPKMPPRQTLVLFRRVNIIFRFAVISDLFVNVELAEHLWGVDRDGEPWGIIFFMRKIQEIHLHAKDVNAVLGHSENDNWQGMTSVVGKKAEDLISFVKHYLNQP